MRKIATFITAAAIGFALTACGAPEAGTVYDKEFTPAKTWTEMVDVTEEECEWETKTKTYYVSGKSKTKTVRELDCEDVVVGQEEVEKSSPDTWVLHFKDEDGEQGSAEVSEDVFNATEVGDWYGEK